MYTGLNYGILLPSFMRFSTRDISVIVPVKDGMVFLERAFRSIRSISNDIEIILVENGSTDSSLQECERLADANTRVFHLSESGVSRARNHGIDAARGKLITILDADDEMLANRIRFIENRKWKDSDFVIGSMQLDDSEQSSYPNEIQIALARGRTLYTPSALIFTKAGFIQLGGYAENLSHAEDMDLILRAKNLGFTNIYSAEHFLIRHFHSNNVSLDRTATASGLFTALRGNVKNLRENL
jgi:glycosyltransferase involved in cell wall biosynthesis